MERGGTPPVTEGGTGKMSGNDVDSLALHMPLPSRPGLASHLSNSLPSTPYQQPRELSFDRNQSPNKGLNNTSPRSVHSESDTSYRPPGKVPFLVGCKYETAMSFSRRRIPYSVGGDKLDKPKNMPPKFLPAESEKKLSKDMTDLYNQILPSEESVQRRRSFTQKLETLLNNEWPGNHIKVHVFGSSGNRLCTSDSDVDICITTPLKALEQVCLLAKALAKHGMERVICVPHAKVPIVKIWDPELQLACDMNVNNTLALENTRMIKTYVDIDERVRPLAMIIKHWTKKRIINDAALGGTLSSYTWICMIINFLQTRNPPILPSLHRGHEDCKTLHEGKLSAFADDAAKLRTFGKTNTESIGELLFHFFRKYSYEMDYERHVISVREGRMISKEDKKWHLMQNNRLCVEEPFNIERNLGNTADDISFRGLHIEIRRAFEFLCQVKLDECLEQYIFPPTEEKVWSKPAPQPRPVLSRSMSQSSRGGKGGGNNNRGGRHQQNQHRSGPSNRRASSAAAMGKTNNLQNGVHQTRDDQLAQIQIHNQLFQHYRVLQAQEAQLRLVLHQKAQAQLYAQASAQSPNPNQSNLGLSYLQQAKPENLRRHNNIQVQQAPLSAPPRHAMFPHQMPFPNNQVQVQNMHSRQSVQTSPSSPSMPSVQTVQQMQQIPDLRDIRRKMQRSANDPHPNSNARSHSQPARSLPLPLQQMPPSAYGYINLDKHHQIVLEQQSVDAYRAAMHEAELSQYMPAMMDSPIDDNLPKEYVGYYVDDAPPPRDPKYYSSIPPIPSYHDLTRRAGGPISSPSRLRDMSRSPSPDISRDRSTSFYSTASAPPTAHFGKSNSTNPGSRRSGPIIIDGCTEAGVIDFHTPPESVSSMFHPPSTSEVASLSDDQGMGTPATDTAIPLRDPQNPYLSDHSPSLVPSFSYTGMPQFGEFPPAQLGAVSSPQSRSTNPSIVDARPATTSPASMGALDEAFQGLGVQYDHPSNGKSKSHEQLFMNDTRSNSVPSPALDLQNIRADLSQGKLALPIPLLSPVREVRTPSPTTSRKERFSIGTESNGGHSRKPSSLSGQNPTTSSNKPLSPSATPSAIKSSQNEGLVQRVNGPLVNGNHTVVPNLPLTTSTWQQQGKKGKKNTHKMTSSLSSLPVNGQASSQAVLERKGG